MHMPGHCALTFEMKHDLLLSLHSCGGGRTDGTDPLPLPDPPPSGEAGRRGGMVLDYLMCVLPTIQYYYYWPNASSHSNQ